VRGEVFAERQGSTFPCLRLWPREGDRPSRASTCSLPPLSVVQEFVELLIYDHIHCLRT
jgi:hypothetical protein